MTGVTGKPPRPEKVKFVEELRKKLQEAKAIYLVDFTGFTVPEDVVLRRRIREAKGFYRVVKNTMLRLALKGTEAEALAEDLAGPNALLLALEDEVAPLKAFYDYSKELGKGRLKKGFLGGKVYEDKELEALAKLPGLQELRAQAVGALAAPLSGLVYALNGLLTKVVVALDQIRQQKEA